MGLTVFPPAAGGLKLYTQTFTSSGTFTLPSGYGASNPLQATVLVVGGGGGGGGGGRNNIFNGNAWGGAGGGSGIAYYLQDILLTENQTVTIGAGGIGGAGATSTTNNVAFAGNSGTDGGNTSFGVYTARGGGYGPGGGGGGDDNFNSGTAARAGTSITDNIFGSLSGGRVPDFTPTNNSFIGQASGGPGGSSGGNSGVLGGRFGGIGIPTFNYLSFQRDTTTTTVRSFSWNIGFNIPLSGASQGIPFTDVASNATSNSIVVSFMPSTQDFNKNWYIPSGGSGGTTGGTAESPGGSAGTINSTFTATPTTQTGASAAANSGAGGGGGAGRRSANSGAGGNGGSGYVRIWYWA
jgi:hypothetical protein